MTNFRKQVSSCRFQLPAILRWGFVFILCLGTFVAGSSSSVAGNHCKDHCNDTYRLRKDFCHAIPLKHERKSCENAAKHAKDNCKHHCG
jgi:hypothetical protein